MPGRSIRDNRRAAYAALALLCAMYAGLALVWSHATPMFEAPDELDHARFVAFLLDQQRLPDTRTELGNAGLEATQGPVYYAAAAAIVRVLGPALPDLHPAINPRYGQPDLNLYLPRRAHDDGALYRLRLFSALGGLFAILGAYALARKLQLGRFTALLAAAGVALLPQFLFISSSISNDSWAAAAGSAGLALILHLDRRAAIKPWQSGLLGLVLGLGAITKASVLILVPACALMLIRHERPHRARLAAHGLAAGAGFVAGGGWFFARNLWLYGSWLNAGALEVIASNQTIAEESRGVYLLRVLPQMSLRSLVGAFGQVNVFLPEGAYAAAVLAGLVSLAGLWLWAWRARLRPHSGWRLAALVIGLNGAAYIVWNLTLFSYQSRLLFPALGAMAALLARGWCEYPPRVRYVLAALVGGGLLALNGVALQAVAAAYAPGG